MPSVTQARATQKPARACPDWCQEPDGHDEGTELVRHVRRLGSVALPVEAVRFDSVVGPDVLVRVDDELLSPWQALDLAAALVRAVRLLNGRGEVEELLDEIRRMQD